MPVLMQIEKEEWKKIDSYSFYEVSNFGRVRSLDHYDSMKRFQKGRVLKQSFDGRGLYLQVVLFDGHSQRKYLVHRLVAKAFVENNDMNKVEVNHKDENKTNNMADNLEWCTHRYNNNYGRKIGLIRGERNPQSKLSYEDVRFIKSHHKHLGGDMTNKALAEMFGISSTNICSIAHGRRWGWLNDNPN